MKADKQVCRICGKKAEKLQGYIHYGSINNELQQWEADLCGPCTRAMGGLLDVMSRRLQGKEFIRHEG